MKDELQFDWSPLGPEWWADAQSACRGTAEQAKFACLRHRGLNRTEAARQAGYSAATDDAMRQSGSRAAQSAAVTEMLAMAVAETGRGEDGLVRRDESKRVLSRLIRSSDPAVRIRAIEQLEKLDLAEREANKGLISGDPADTAKELICALPCTGLGASFAVGMWFDVHHQIVNFPYLRQVAPLLARAVPADWERWCSGDPSIQELAAGPFLTGDALVTAVKGTAVRKGNGHRHVTPSIEQQQETFT